MYKNRHRCCCCECNKKNQINPTHIIVVNQAGVMQAIPCNDYLQQLVSTASPTIQTTPLDTKIGITPIENTSRDTRREITSSERTPVDTKIEINSIEKTSERS